MERRPMGSGQLGARGWLEANGKWAARGRGCLEVNGKGAAGGRGCLEATLAKNKVPSHDLLHPSVF